MVKRDNVNENVFVKKSENIPQSLGGEIKKNEMGTKCVMEDGEYCH